VAEEGDIEPAVSDDREGRRGADGATLRIDLATAEIAIGEAGSERRLALASPEAFAILSEAWLRSGWANRYSYTFSWLGRPVIQLPEDLIRLQELLYLQQPDVVLETGIAHGGSVVFCAGLCRLIGKGRVVAVDVEIRPHNRAALEAHALAPLITLIEGDSAAPDTIRRVRAAIGAAESVLLILDSDHRKAHVRAELDAYAPLIRPGGHIVVADGVMAQLSGLPGGRADWAWDNPGAAIAEFLAAHQDFERVPPPSLFNDRGVASGGSYWPGGYLRRAG
jgi:cephalosporin hydroxylase